MGTCGTPKAVPQGMHVGLGPYSALTGCQASVLRPHFPVLDGYPVELGLCHACPQPMLSLRDTVELCTYVRFQNLSGSYRKSPQRNV